MLAFVAPSTAFVLAYARSFDEGERRELLIGTRSDDFLIPARSMLPLTLARRAERAVASRSPLIVVLFACAGIGEGEK